MTQTALYPLLMNPALHVKVWGGRRLATLMGKTLPTAEPYGESWEVHDTATVANGPLAGKTLAELLQEYGHDLVGAKNDPAVGFPLLVKFLDATDWLSVQVHPNDAQAQQYDGEPRGKTEAWYVLAGEPGSKLVYGMQAGTSKAEMAAAIRENRLEPLLNYVEVQPGDALFVSPGTVHALGPGLVIYEIQQSSDLTYRLYDWGRLGLDGKPRAMHIEKGTAVSITEYAPTVLRGTGDRMLVECEYFRTTTRAFTGAAVEFPTHGAFHLLTVIEGALTVEAAGVSITVQHGQSAVIPAALSAYTVSGTGKLLTSWQP
jgi:mannose-6-phosphate isomerase